MERAIEVVQKNIKAIRKKYLSKPAKLADLEGAMDALAESQNALAEGQQAMADTGQELSALEIEIQNHFADATE